MDYEVLVVDDDSPDLTWQRIEELGRSRPRVRVLRRIGKRDYASAIIDGVQSASGEVVATIDADLQHDPDILPRMLSELLAGAELVIGSRYMPGGGTSDWSALRRLMSQTANLPARLVLGRRLADPGSGYFMLRREDFLRVAPRLDGRGYRILMDIVANLKPHRVAEVPYTFRARREGTSKMSLKIVLSYARLLGHLALRRLG
jgi:dolichol-phosphate mannosyltransferase